MNFHILILSSFLLSFQLNSSEPYQVQNGVNNKTEPFQGFSDTTQIQLNDSNFLKIESPYYNGHLFSSKNGRGWKKLYLGILLEDMDSVVEIGPETTSKIAYQLMPSGMLKINDSTTFLFGTKSTFDSQGIILRTTNFGKSWKPTLHPVPETQMSPHDLVFINSQIGLAFFGVNQSEYIQYGLTLDGGETWEFLRSKTRQIEFKKRKLKFSAKLEFKGQQIRKIEGQYSKDRGKTYHTFTLSH